MNHLTRLLIRFGILQQDLDYHLIRASMVIIFAFFGYQKWFKYEAQALIPYISHGPLIFWMYPVFGMRGATYFLGVAEWLFGALLFLGFWNKKLGVLGALGSCFSFVATVTIIPFMPDGWAASAGGFPAMTERVAFLMKDLVLLTVSFYLLKQDLMRATLSGKPLHNNWTIGNETSDGLAAGKMPGTVEQLRYSRMGPSITRTNIPICWAKKAEDLDSSDVKPLPIAPRRTTGWSRIEGTKKPGRIKDAMLISQEGENVLLQLINEGAKLRPQSVLAKGVLQQLARRSKKEVGELIDPPLSSAKGFDVGVTK